jgi:hypothetical protein
VGNNVFEAAGWTPQTSEDTLTLTFSSADGDAPVLMGLKVTVTGGTSVEVQLKLPDDTVARTVTVSSPICYQHFCPF